MSSTTEQQKPDEFSTTQYTLLERWLSEDSEGRLKAARHIMKAYAHPLKVYYLGSTFRTMGDAEDMVRGFFADRLDREDFLQKWLDSRKRLRHWLITAFKHFLYEQIRADARHKHQQEPEDGHLIAAEDAEAQPETAFHRAVAISLVQQAMQLTAEACESEGLGQHWYALMQRRIEGRAWPEIAEELDITPSRLRVMSRTAENRFRRCLRDLLAWPSAADVEIDAEIRSLLELLS